LPLRGKGIRPVAVSSVRRFAHSPHRRGGVGRSELVRYLGLGPQNIVQRHDTDRRTILLSHQYEEISGFSDHLIYRFSYRGIRRNGVGRLRGHGLFVPSSTAALEIKPSSSCRVLTERIGTDVLRQQQ
jgi:hypothetical protein